jgi:hypothetical protein
MAQGADGAMLLTQREPDLGFRRFAMCRTVYGYSVKQVSLTDARRRGAHRPRAGASCAFRREHLSDEGPQLGGLERFGQNPVGSRGGAGGEISNG